MYLSRPNETLEKHIKYVLDQYNILNDNKKIDLIINNIIEKLCKENKILIEQKNNIKILFLESLKLHDEGKKNPYFQSYIGNEKYSEYKFSKLNKHHAEISAIYYCIEMYNEYVAKLDCKKERPIQEMLKDIILSFAYNIYRHHSNLENLDKSIFIADLIRYYEKNKKQFINVDLTNIEFLYRFKNRSSAKYTNEFTYYLLFKLSYSILVTCDFMAVYNHNKKALNINIVDNNIRKSINKKFTNDSVIKDIRLFENNNNGVKLSVLNKYRSEMFLESEKQLIKYKESNNIFYLEAPTGCGKSLTSLNLALKLFDETINKLYYVAPFNNISEQTNEVIKDVFYENGVMVNSREDIFINNEDDENINYDKDFLNSQLINYPVSLVSHVRFFDILFSGGRFKNLMLSNLCNSVIVLDEIQAYKNKLWINIINVFKEFAEMLNLKIIIMSATLPKMDELLDNKDYVIPDLIKNRKYYYDYFKNRVKFDFSLLKKEKNNLEEVFNKVEEVIKTTEKHRILIECLTTKTAEKFYNEMIKYKEDGFLIYKIMGITNTDNRKYIIDNIQKKIDEKYANKKIILIGTQCIEAGIDIDMQIGFKDISVLDAEEQFAGRIERNFNDTGMIYFYDIDDGNFIYKGDYRTEKNLKNPEWRKILESKNFHQFYKRNYKWLLEKEATGYKKFKIDLINLNYIKIQETMKLIDSKTYSFLFMCAYENKTDAKKLLNEYLNRNQSKLNYAEKLIKLRSIKKKLNSYIYNINSFKFNNDIALKKINNLYIVENDEDYFDNLKDNKLTDKSSLNLEKFINYTDLFL